MPASAFPVGATLGIAEVVALAPTHEPHADALGDLRHRMQRSGQWREGQMAGRRWPIACVSLEITQRCNLDCTLCYLSESSEAVRDLPLEEVFRRIDLIVAHYGAGTDVQVSGGEPTLRRRDELLAIVTRITQRGLRSSLFTNGIKATRELLTELARAGLTDVAFHVDMTQQRAGFASEAALNSLRSEYIARARGLGLGVFFNTTVHAANAGDVPMLAAYFKAHADVVRFVSFQLQAETGRGVLGARAGAITNDSVAAALCAGVGTPLHFNTLLAGHHDCNRSAVVLVINGRAYDAFGDENFIRRFMRETAMLQIDRGTQWRAARSLVRAALSRPALVLASARWALAFAWEARRDLLAARGRVHKLTLFTHNFMDACNLDRERLDACVFMAVTQHGPMSMCAYNAKRDHYLLQPLATSLGEWQPLAALPAQPIKFLKGRARDAWLQARRTAAQPPAEPTRP
jgi:7,8-dihydro-6-hydroxymethylpterin dimethyltransferase